MKLLLASQSPRRKELLKSLDFEFQTVKIDCNEVFPKSLPSSKVAEYLSLLKANSFRELIQDEVLITADTVVCKNENILGKPHSEKEALQMLLTLSNSEHKVFTGITIKTVSEIYTESDEANVVFDSISKEEALYYINKYKPFDKAGSYGIQEWLGMAKIKKIEGNFYTIMGLPTHLIYHILNKIKFKSGF